ncbi:MAG: helix-turn-helix transcriptional regulator [Clostridiales bacterium]|nr:helix-turn-helix transcriptional regulator [Clostridiales bacterium]
MPGEYLNPYQKARKTTCLTQEQAAERLGLSTESLKQYELGKRVPSNAVVWQMVQIYDTSWLALEHLRDTSEALGVLPEVTVQSLPTAAIQLINRVLDFADRHRDRQLLRIAEDGVIDEAERPEFDDIVRDLDGIVGAALQVKFTPGIKKGRLDVGASKRQDLRLASEIDRKNNIPHIRAGRKHNFAREGGALL